MSPLEGDRALKRRHRSAEFLQFLNAVDASVPI
jgi:hypothetical protein